ncbi:TrmH family RNA methyltransferase [Candidatus Laterigemmans baculatus]|uniref:TrmH family RNA methyltransferase n=1 Tax=Candidatus Laterigemmans baculatus TaxID=2770505 RepID=UPI0013D916C4|nr:RNA methyltransferase [Candidatus Laterigemmans baculatus]
MARIVIDSLEDPRLQPYRALNHRSSTARGSRFIAEGRLVVERLLASRYECASVLVEQGRHQAWVESLEQSLENSRKPSLEVLEIRSADLRQLTGFDFHRGVLACGIRPPMPTIDQLPPAADAGPLVVACGVTDAENLGSTIRSAAAFGVHSLVITPDAADPLSRRVLRVSMAAALRMTVYTADAPESDFRRLAAERGYRLVATTLAPGAKPLAEFHHDQRPLAILLGDEAQGLPPAILATATDQLTIPMRQGIDSLNVAVAAGITFYALLGESSG